MQLAYSLNTVHAHAYTQAHARRSRRGSSRVKHAACCNFTLSLPWGKLHRSLTSQSISCAPLSSSSSSLPRNFLIPLLSLTAHCAICPQFLFLLYSGQLSKNPNRSLSQPSHHTTAGLTICLLHLALMIGCSLHSSNVHTCDDWLID